jgi:type II secretory pathway predicted ATPase ExeA
MALDAKTKEMLRGLDLPSESQIRPLVDRFLAVSGFTEQEFADLVGVSRVSINHLRNGRWGTMKGGEENSLNTRYKVKAVLDQHPLLDEVIASATLFETEEYLAVRKAVHKAAKLGHAYCIDGAPGTGKTFTLKRVIQEHNESNADHKIIYVYCRRNTGFCDLLKCIADRAGVPSRGRTDQLLKKLGFFFRGQRASLCLDEAQHLSVDVSDMTRQLLDEPPYFGLVFAGSHAVQNTFRNLSLEQLRRRIAKTIILNGITRAEAEKAIAAELGKLPANVVSHMIERATVVDDYRAAEQRIAAARDRQPAPPPLTFISSGVLFSAIAEVKASRRAKGATA